MNAGKAKLRIQGKKPSHRRAMIKSQLVELLRTGKIQTTPAKARAVAISAERLIGIAKQDTPASRTKVNQILPTTKSIERLYQLLPAWSARTSGYTSTIRTLPRKGDNASQVFLMLMDMKVEKVKKSVIQKTIEKQAAKPKKTTKK
jgi:large subunit ribosomal protein L17